MIKKDCLRRFLFEELGIRGEWIQLEDSFQAAKRYQKMPDIVAMQLGQTLAAVTLLSATIKFKGSMILQLQGDGALKTLVAQANESREIRGLVRCDEVVKEGSLQQIMGKGRLVLSMESEIGNPYQGIVSLEGEGLAGVVENYFKQSEQLKTRLWLFANSNQAAGLFLQELPSKKNDEADWERVEILANTVTEDELLNLDCETMLHRLFNEEKIRVFEPENVTFKCQCSREKISVTLKSLGREELKSAFDEQGVIEVSCEFCGQQYSFDKAMLESILK